MSPEESGDDDTISGEIDAYYANKKSQRHMKVKRTGWGWRIVFF